MQRVLFYLVFQAASILLGAASQAPIVSFGILNSAGIIVPFAVHDGSAWTQAWPEPSEELQTDGMLENVRSFWKKRGMQAPTQWTLPGNRLPARRLEVIAHVAFDDHCLRQIGLLTSYQDPSLGDRHARRLVFNGAADVRMTANIVQSASAQAPWRDLIDAARGAFPAPERAGFRFRTLYAHRAGGTRVLYFEAVRMHGVADKRDPRCEQRTIVNGWVVADGASTPSLSDVKSFAEDCDEKRAPRLHPLGVATIDGRTVWLAAEHYYESEAYFVIDVGKGGVRRILEVQGPGC